MKKNILGRILFAIKLIQNWVAKQLDYDAAMYIENSSFFASTNVSYFKIFSTS